MLTSSVHFFKAHRQGASVLSLLVAFSGLAMPMAHAQSFAPPVHYKFGVMPDDMVIGDFNGDGKNDLVTANGASDNVSVMLGNGDGTFAAKKNFGVGKKPHSVAIGDFNGDGKSDLVAANSESDTVSVLLGKGDGTFIARKDFDVYAKPRKYESGLPYSVAIGDFNGDGKSDFVTANFYGDTVSVLLGNGDGTFAAPVDYDGGQRSSSVVVGDFNGDGKSDLATVNNDNDGEEDAESQCFNVLLGNGDGTFAPKKSIKAGSFPTRVQVADFNGDGKSDLVAANSVSGAGSDSGLSVLLGNGDGTFAARKHFKTGEQPSSVAIGDINSDGKSDLVTGNRSGANLSVLLGNGDGTFAATKNYEWDKTPEIVVINDFNGDGKNDIAFTTEDSVSVLLGK